MMRPAVLFLCTGNSARSQMAEAFARRLLGEFFDVYSAGTEPRGIHPLTVQVMQEIGYDLSGHRSKHLQEFLGRLPVRYLVSVCSEADRACPTVWPGVVQRWAWPLDDPAAATGSEADRLRQFRAVRDQILARVKAWAKEVLPRGAVV